MATVQGTPTTGVVEAVIISGPKKGAIVQLGDDNRLLSDEYVLTPEEERAFDEVQALLDRAVQAAREAADSAHALLDEVRELRRVVQHVAA